MNCVKSVESVWQSVRHFLSVECVSTVCVFEIKDEGGKKTKREK